MVILIIGVVIFFGCSMIYCFVFVVFWVVVVFVEVVLF